MNRKVESILRTPLGNYLVTILKTVKTSYKFDEPDDYVLEEVLVPREGLGVFIENYFDVKNFDEVVKNGSVK